MYSRRGIWIWLISFQILVHMYTISAIGVGSRGARGRAIAPLDFGKFGKQV